MSFYSETCNNIIVPGNNDFSLSGSVTFMHTIPFSSVAPTGAPTQFHVVVLNSTAVEVQYELPTIDSRNGIIRGFKIFVEEAGSGDGSEMVIDVVGNSTLAYIVTGLKPATAYVFSMLAYTVADGPRGIHLTAITNPEGELVLVKYLFNHIHEHEPHYHTTMPLCKLSPLNFINYSGTCI